MKTPTDFESGFFKYRIVMFNPNRITDCLLGLIGFRQSNKTGIPRIDEELTRSSTGMFVDQTAHSLITQENLIAISENIPLSDIALWDAATSYKSNELSRVDGKVYRAKRDNSNKTPTSNTDDWKETNMLSEYLLQKYKGASINLFNTVFTNKKLWESAKTILSDISLFEGAGNLSKRVEKNNRFVGFIVTPTYKDTVALIKWIGLQFDTANPNFKLYLYHSSQYEPLKEIPITHSKTYSFAWHELSEELSIRFNSNEYNDGGFFYIGYYESDLLGKAIWKDQDFSGNNCHTCNSVSEYLISQWSKYVSIQPFYVDESFLNNERKLFDTDKIIQLSNQNFGLNMKIQVKCDISDLVCRNKEAFANALRMQVTHDLLSDMAYSSRNNQLKEQVSQKAMYALDNRENYQKGFSKQLDEAVKAISFDMSSLNSICLPCENANTGVEISSLF